jgi:hypothetical protein
MALVALPATGSGGRDSRFVTLDKKSMPIVAWYVLSNESYMKRVIKEVLPTVFVVRIAIRASVFLHEIHGWHLRLGIVIPLCSPKKTSLQSVSNRQRQQRKVGTTHLNFFKGFEYEPTPELEAMAMVMLSRGGRGETQGKSGSRMRGATKPGTRHAGIRQSSRITVVSISRPTQ